MKYLPPEILIYIFSLLSRDELGRSVAQVCRSWNALSKDRELKKTLTYHLSCKQGLPTLRRLISESPSLVKLIIILGSNDFGFLHILRVIAKHCPELKYLALRNCNGISSQSLYFVVNACSKLERLHLEGKRMDPDCINLLPMIPNLTHFIIPDYLKIDDHLLSTLVQKCKKIQQLNLSNCEITSIVEMSNALAGSLEWLWVDGLNLTEKCYRALGACQKMTFLNIFNCHKLTRIGLDTGISMLTNLSTLRLHGCLGLKSHDLVHFFRNNEHLIKLTHLYLYDCDLDNDVMVAIGIRCLNVTNLGLTLEENVTNAGVEGLVRGCRNITSILLVASSDEQLTSHVYYIIAQNLPHLVNLNFNIAAPKTFSLDYPKIAWSSFFFWAKN